jgi:limonene-1,2-epoxide hydrolase
VDSIGSKSLASIGPLGLTTASIKTCKLFLAAIAKDEHRNRVEQMSANSMKTEALAHGYGHMKAIAQMAVVLVKWSQSQP